ncbi:uncharacterized protein LOC122507433 [Leptopilina heterotoma]|uniref:uncharacterized protein LOC122507433 n=1 Tax=Leptopilina heterotoma TaxID=63436 RepID=UPI001CA7D5C2|nr:uncharacterized protein LOC122507433 [Leptopilina heterotoma]
MSAIKKLNDKENMDTNEFPFAVVNFEDGIEIIKTDWAVYEDGIITRSYFPPNTTSLQFRKILCNDETQFDKLEWSNQEGEPYLVKKVFDFAKRRRGGDWRNWIQRGFNSSRIWRKWIASQIVNQLYRIQMYYRTKKKIRVLRPNQRRSLKIRICRLTRNQAMNNASYPRRRIIFSD